MAPPPPNPSGSGFSDDVLEQTVFSERERLEQRLALKMEEIEERIELYEETKSELSSRVQECDRKVERFSLNSEEWKQWRERRNKASDQLLETRHTFQREIETLEEEYRELVEELEALERVEELL